MDYFKRRAKKKYEQAGGKMVSKIGIIGLGWWGKQLLEYFRSTKGVKVTSLWSRNPKRAKEIELKDASFYTDMEEMFKKENLDGVVIATIPPAHLLPTKLAAERGIHVFCEKPMAATLEDCDEMIEICKKNKVKLMIAFKHRFTKAFNYVKQNGPVLGKPFWTMYAYPLWKVEDPGWKFVEEGTKGIIVENMVHAIDALRYLMGEVKRVYAEGDNFIFKNVKSPDSAIFTLRFTNGAIGAIGGGCTSDKRISREYLDIHFENGVVQIFGMLDCPFNLRVLWRENGAVEEHIFEGSDGVREEIRHFIDCIQKDREPMVTGEDGRKDLEVALAVISSIRENKVIHVG